MTCGNEIRSKGERRGWRELGEKGSRWWRRGNSVSRQEERTERERRKREEWREGRKEGERAGREVNEYFSRVKGRHCVTVGGGR